MNKWLLSLTKILGSPSFGNSHLRLVSTEIPNVLGQKQKENEDSTKKRPFSKINYNPSLL